MKKEEAVDVCFILEGTYPYISGGVSTWIHQAISSMPDLNFAIYYIGSEADSLGELKYELPSNTGTIETVFLFDDENVPPPVKSSAPGKKQVDFALDILMQLIEKEVTPSQNDLTSAIGVFQQMAEHYPLEVFWKMPQTWNFLTTLYQRKYADESYISFFWNAKFIVKPIWELLRSYSRIPEAKLYHSVCTGYAGFLTGVVKLLRDRPFLLSEHGIYVRERINDLLTSEWSPNLNPDFARSVEGLSPFRQAWIESFTFIGEFCYDHSDRITSLFERNASIQTEFGADRNRIDIIPNGIHPERFATLEEKRNNLRNRNPNRKTVGFLGRIVPIKDLRTLIRAARLTCDVFPDTEFLVAGPQDEDPEYFEGCCQLIDELDLKNNVTLPGRMKLDDALPMFDIMVLSSVSEGLPFAVLESFAAGIPVVSTDVGACSELIYGRDGQNREKGGLVVPVGDSAGLAKALVALLEDRDYQDKCGQAGKIRANKHYREDDVMSRFQKLYLDMAASDAVAN